MSISVSFGHGLGDCVHFAHQLPLYVRRGIEIKLSCPEDKEVLFRASGVEQLAAGGQGPGVPWHESPGVTATNAERFWLHNKSAVNLSREPLPFIGLAEELWDELCSQRLDLRPHLSPHRREFVRDYLAKLSKPVVLFHGMGNSLSQWKNLPPALTREIYRGLLDAMDGTLLLLDWDNRVPRLANWRVRHLTDDWEWLDTETLLCLLDEADLIVGIDSGPAHAARFTSTPTVVLFPHKDHYPTRWCLPRSEQVCLVTDGTAELNRKTRHSYNILESPSSQLDPEFVSRTCARMLQGSRYLSSGQLGRDVLLQEFAREWERGRENSLTDYVDRDRSYDLVLRECSRRFRNPTIVETGCIRQEEDWRGAGYSTYLLGIYAEAADGNLTSVDNNPRNCKFAGRVMKSFRRTRVVFADSVKFLGETSGPIDFLLLDSMDTEVPGAARHALCEIQAALHALHSGSIVVFDDSPYYQRSFRGKGSLAIPWMLENGWKILFSGYQTVLHREM